MDDSFGGGFTTSGSTQNESEKKPEGIISAMIKQIYKQPDDVFIMWGSTYKMIKLVAIVRNIEHSSTKITYTLEDITGKINAHLWVEEGEAPSSSSGVMLGTYARIVGSVRQTGDAKSIMIYSIQAAKSPNEINSHYLEAIHARYKSEDLYRGGSLAATGSGASVKMEIDGIGGGASGASQLKGKSSAVFNAVQELAKANPEVGASRSELAKKFPQISASELGKILDDLSGEGNIYSTIDPDHFLSCY